MAGLATLGQSERLLKLSSGMDMMGGFGLMLL